MSEFYTSGGLNDSTGREVFEDGTPLVRQGDSYDPSSTSGNVGAGNGLGDGNLVATTGGNQGDSTGFAGQTTGTRGGDNYNERSTGSGTGISSDPRDHYDNSAKERVRGEFENDSNDNNNKPGLKEKVKDAIGSNKNDNQHHGHEHKHGHHNESENYSRDSSNVNTGGLTGGFGNTEGSHARVADRIDGDYQGGRQTGDAYDSNRNTGDNYSSDNQGQDRSAGFGRDGGVGNQGVGAGGYTSGSGVSSGAAGTDRFDVDNSSSGVTHGQAIGDKRIENDNIGRHGDDFTGGAAATGGAYTNPNTKTGLTGRETTTTGVQDKDANPTQSSGGILGKIKNAVGLSHDNSAQANASTERDNY